MGSGTSFSQTIKEPKSNRNFSDAHVSESFKIIATQLPFLWFAVETVLLVVCCFHTNSRQ